MVLRCGVKASFATEVLFTVGGVVTALGLGALGVLSLGNNGFLGATGLLVGLVVVGSVIGSVGVGLVISTNPAGRVESSVGVVASAVGFGFENNAFACNGVPNSGTTKLNSNNSGAAVR